jgi:hypothetical protein
MAQTVVVLKRAHFFSIDNDIIDVHAKTIGAIGIAVYAVLARYANRRTGECWPCHHSYSAHAESRPLLREALSASSGSRWPHHRGGAVV